MVRASRSSKVRKGGLAIPDTAKAPSIIAATVSKIAQTIGEEELPTLEQVQDNYVKRFSIDTDFLQNIQHQDEKLKKRKREPVNITYCVKKPKTKEKTKTVCVLKPAAFNPLDNVTDYAGPRFTKDGSFISHSILGSLTDFKSEAQKRGEFDHLFKKTDTGDNIQKPKRGPRECKALATWNKKITDRCCTENFLAEKLKRPVEDLVMRTSDIYASWINERQETADALEATVSGFGQARTNSTFWKQGVKIGQDDNGIITTLKKSDIGDCQPIEFIEVPDLIKREKDNGQDIPQRTYKANYTEYLLRQRVNVKDMIHILNPHHPDLAHLSVEGKGQGDLKPVTSKEPCKGHITLHSPIALQVLQELEEPSSNEHLNEFKGPALSVNNQLITWKNITEENSLRPATLTFKTELGQKQIQKITLTNCGSTVLHYDWQKIPYNDPFGVIRPRLPRFYFFSEYGVLPPGGTVQLHVMYKSDFPGNFKETWRLRTRPVLSAGALILISFIGRTTVGIFHQEELKILEKNFQANQGIIIAKDVVRDIMLRVMTPTMPRSPISAYKSEDEEFKLEHPWLIYHSSKLKQMETLYRSVCDSGLITSKPKEDFTVHNLRNVICDLDFIDWPSFDHENYTELMEDMTSKQYLFTKQYLSLTADMSFEQPKPPVSMNQLHTMICKQILQTMVERFSDSAYTLAIRIKIPIKQQKIEEKENKEDNIIDKNKKKSPVHSKKKGLKDTEAKNSAKSPTQGKQLSATPSRNTVTPSRNRKRSTDSPQNWSPPLTGSPVIESFSPVLKEMASSDQRKNYSEKLYLLAYTILQAAIDNIEVIFEGLDSEDIHVSG